MEEELVRLLTQGITADELADAKKSLLEQRKLSRAQDGALASALLGQIATGRTMAFSAALDFLVFRPLPLHGLLEILGTVRMVVAVLDDPLVEIRVALKRLGCCPRLILFRRAPRVVVEIIEQF